MRKFFFFIKDLVFNNGRINKNVLEISTYLENSQSQTKNKQVKAILKYAIENVPYYSKIEKSELNYFPIVDKYLIRQNLDNFISKKFNKGELIRMVTSGSTGLPFESFQDKNKKDRNTADAIVFANKAGYNLGEKLAYFKIWNEFNNKNFVKRLMENILPVNVFSLSKINIKKLLSSLNNHKSIHFLGYASAIEEIANHVVKNNFKVYFRTKSIITMSEGLPIAERERIKRAFNCNNVYARYSNMENGIIAQQTNSDNYYLVNTASYIIEIIDDLDMSLDLGKVGRIVVTDLYNKGMPFIRYDTGDLGALKLIKENGCENLVLSSIEGRKMDAVYDTEGNLVSSFVITNGMWKYPEILQYQFIQVGKKSYLFKLNVENLFEREDELINDFRIHLGNKALIEIQYVSEIPLLSSGKRKKVVNEWKVS